VNRTASAGRWLLALAALLLALLCAELWVRAAGLGSPTLAEDLFLRWEPGSPWELQPEPGVDVGLKPGFDGRMVYLRANDGAEVHSAAVETSSWGLRGPEPSPEPADGQWRILALGDSITFGQGVEGEQTLVAQAERALRHSGRVEVINAGVPSWDGRMEAAWLDRVGYRLRPHLVVQLVFLNDVAPPELPGAGALDDLPLNDPGWARTEAGVRRASHLVNLGMRSVERRRLARELSGGQLHGSGSWLDGLREPRAEAKAAEQAAWLLRSCSTHGIPCVVALLPPFATPSRDPGWDILEMIAGQAEAAALPVLHLERSLQALEPAERVLFPADPHPSPRAHRLIGEALAEGLSPWLAEPERLEALVERQREALAAGGDQR